MCCSRAAASADSEVRLALKPESKSGPNALKKPASCFLWRTPPSTISSVPCHSVWVTPSVALMPFLSPKSNGVAAPRRLVTSSLDRQRHAAAARQPEMLVVGGDVEIGAGALPVGPAEIADRVLLAQLVVLAIAVGADARWHAPTPRTAPPMSRGRVRGQIAFQVVERAEARLHARRRRQVDAVLGDDVDDAADRAVAVEHRAGIAAGDLDALDAVLRDGAEIDAGHVDVVEPAAVDQHQRVRRCRRRRSRACRRWSRTVHLPNRLRTWMPGSRASTSCSVMPGRALDVLRGDDGRRRAGDDRAGDDAGGAGGIRRRFGARRRRRSPARRRGGRRVAPPTRRRVGHVDIRQDRGGLARLRRRRSTVQRGDAGGKRATSSQVVSSSMPPWHASFVRAPAGRSVTGPKRRRTNARRRTISFRRTPKAGRRAAYTHSCFGS